MLAFPAKFSLMFNQTTTGAKTMTKKPTKRTNDTFTATEVGVMMEGLRSKLDAAIEDQILLIRTINKLVNKINLPFKEEIYLK